MAKNPKDIQIPAHTSEFDSVSDESVNILAGKIHQLEFVDLQYKLKTYSCRQCGHVAIKHRIANCLDVFCYECYGQYHGKTCPVCGTVIIESIHDDDFMKTVLNFNVACEFKKNGCQTVVRLGEFLDHVRNCRQATKRLLPKVYKVNPQTEALDQMNTHFEDIKCFMRNLQTENKQLRDAITEVQTSTVATTEQMTTMTNDLQKQLAALKKGMNNQEKEIHKLKNVIHALQTNQHESGVAISGHVTTVTNKVLSRLGEIKMQNDKQFPDIKEDANKLEKDLLELKNSTKGQLTTVTDNLQSISEQIEIINKELQEVKTKHEEESVEIKNAIAGVAGEIPLVYRELQNQRETGATNEQMTCVTKQFLSRFYRIEMQNKIQLEYKQTKSKEFLSFLRRYGETLPRDLEKEVNSGDSLDTTFNWTITGIREKIRKYKEEGVFAESEEFSTPLHGLKFRAKLWRVSEAHMCIHLYFTNKSSADSRPFFHSRKYVLVDQSKGGGKKDVVMLDQPLFGQNSTKDMTSDYFWTYYFFPFNLLQDSDKYVKNDEILVRIIFEPIALMFKRVSSMDGTLLVRIDNYRERKRDTVEEIRRWLTTESFYTSDKGHRMDLLIFINGNGPNGEKGISIYPKFRIGEWDDSLSYPIKCKYTRVLMDQSDAPTKTDITHESSVQEYKNYVDFYDYKDFISHTVVEKPPYLKDDSLLIRYIFEIFKP